jgi:hypothetical protein
LSGRWSSKEQSKHTLNNPSTFARVSILPPRVASHASGAVGLILELLGLDVATIQFYCAPCAELMSSICGTLMCGGRTALTKLVSCTANRWLKVERGKKNPTATARAPTHAHDQANLFDNPGKLIRPAVANVFQYYLYCATKIGRQKFGFGAPKKKCVESSAALT